MRGKRNSSVTVRGRRPSSGSRQQLQRRGLDISREPPFNRRPSPPPLMDQVYTRRERPGPYPDRPDSPRFRPDYGNQLPAPADMKNSSLSEPYQPLTTTAVEAGLRLLTQIASNMNSMPPEPPNPSYPSEIHRPLSLEHDPRTQYSGALHSSHPPPPPPSRPPNLMELGLDNRSFHGSSNHEKEFYTSHGEHGVLHFDGRNSGELDVRYGNELQRSNLMGRLGSEGGGRWSIDGRGGERGCDSVDAFGEERRYGGIGNVRHDDRYGDEVKYNSFGRAERYGNEIGQHRSYGERKDFDKARLGGMSIGSGSVPTERRFDEQVPGDVGGRLGHGDTDARFDLREEWREYHSRPNSHERLSSFDHPLHAPSQAEQRLPLSEERDHPPGGHFSGGLDHRLHSFDSTTDRRRSSSDRYRFERDPFTPPPKKHYRDLEHDRPSSRENSRHDSGLSSRENSRHDSGLSSRELMSGGSNLHPVVDRLGPSISGLHPSPKGEYSYNSLDLAGPADEMERLTNIDIQSRLGPKPSDTKEFDLRIKLNESRERPFLSSTPIPLFPPANNPQPLVCSPAETTSIENSTPKIDLSALSDSLNDTDACIRFLADFKAALTSGDSTTIPPLSSETSSKLPLVASDSALPSSTTSLDGPKSKMSSNRSVTPKPLKQPAPKTSGGHDKKASQTKAKKSSVKTVKVLKKSYGEPGKQVALVPSHKTLGSSSTMKAQGLVNTPAKTGITEMVSSPLMTSVSDPTSTSQGGINSIPKFSALEKTPTTHNTSVAESEGSECELVIDENAVKDNLSLNAKTLRAEIGSEELSFVSVPVKGEPYNFESSVSVMKSNVAKVVNSELKQPLIEKLCGAADEVNLLQRLYDSMLFLVRILNGREPWHVSLVPRVRTLFSAYYVGSAKAALKTRYLFKKELNSLKQKCHDDVSKWQEQIRRFNLLASTLPKSKADFENEGIEEKTDVVFYVSKNPEMDICTLSGNDGGSERVKEVSLSGNVGESLIEGVHVKTEVKEEGEVSDSFDEAVEGEDLDQDKVMWYTGRADDLHTQLLDNTSFPIQAFQPMPSSTLPLDKSVKEEKQDDSKQFDSYSKRPASVEQLTNVGQALSTGQAAPIVGQVTSTGDIEGCEIAIDPGDDKGRYLDGDSSSGERSMSVCSMESGDNFTVLDSYKYEGKQIPCDSSSPAPLQESSSPSKECTANTEMHRLAGSLTVGDDGVEGSEHQDKTKQRSTSLSSGELTPTPPSSPRLASDERKLVQAAGVVTSKAGVSRPLQQDAPKKQGSDHDVHRKSSKQQRGGQRSRSRHRRPSFGSRKRRRSSREHYKRSRSPIHRSLRQSSRSPKRSRSPIHRSLRRGSRSPIRNRACVERRRPRSVSPCDNRKRGIKQGSKVKDQAKRMEGGKGQTKCLEEEEEEDLELLQLKKEVILSIVQKPSNESPPLSNISNHGAIVKKSDPKARLVPKSSLAVMESSGCKSDHGLKKSDSVTEKELPSIAANLKGQLDASLSKKSTQSSVSSSRANSGANSPAWSSMASPLSDGMGGPKKTQLKSRHSSSLSIKVCPGKEKTWKIQPFHIYTSGADSESEGEGAGDGGTSTPEGSKQGYSSDISLLLAEARKVATQASMNCDRAASVSSMESLDLPSPPSALPPAQQREYLLLKKKLALHEKKKSLKDSASSSNSKGCAPVTSVAAKKSVQSLSDIKDSNQLSRPDIKEISQQVKPDNKVSSSINTKESGRPNCNESSKKPECIGQPPGADSMECQHVTKELDEQSSLNANISGVKESDELSTEQSVPNPQHPTSKNSPPELQGTTTQVPPMSSKPQGTGITQVPPIPSTKLASKQTTDASKESTRDSGVSANTPAKNTNKKKSKRKQAKVTQCKKKMTEYAEKVEQGKLKLEEEQRKITCFTNQMTECVAEIEEHEHSMEVVQQKLLELHEQLKNAEVALVKCEERMSGLQEDVRCAKLRKVEFTAEVKNCEELLLKQRKKLQVISGETMMKDNPVIEYDNVSESEVSSTVKISSKSKILVANQAEYEAISDSENMKGPISVSQLAKPTLEIEPISDVEDMAVDGNKCVPFPEIEPVSDAEQENNHPIETENVTDAESETDNGTTESPSNETPLFLREHDYCKPMDTCPADLPAASTQFIPGTLGKAYDSTVLSPITFTNMAHDSEGMATKTEIITEVENEPDDSTCICRRVVPFEKTCATSAAISPVKKLCRSEKVCRSDPSVSSNSSSLKSSPASYTEHLTKKIYRSDPSGSSKGSSVKSGPASSGDVMKALTTISSSVPNEVSSSKPILSPLINSNPLPTPSGVLAYPVAKVLTVAMQSALTPTLLQFPNVLQRCPPSVGPPIQSVPISSTTSNTKAIQPLLNSLVQVLNKNSLTNISPSTQNVDPKLSSASNAILKSVEASLNVSPSVVEHVSSSDNPKEDLSKLCDDQSSQQLESSASVHCGEEDWPSLTTSYFHHCTEDSFIVSSDTPPLVIVPRRKFARDASLTIQSESISDVALEAVRKSVVTGSRKCRVKEDSELVSSMSSSDEVIITKATDSKSLTTASPHVTDSEQDLPSSRKQVGHKGRSSTAKLKDTDSEQDLSSPRKQVGHKGRSSTAKLKDSDQPSQGKNLKLSKSLQKYMDEIEQLKGKIAAKSVSGKESLPIYHLISSKLSSKASAASGSGKQPPTSSEDDDPTETCARTSGLRKIKSSTTQSSSKSASDEVENSSSSSGGKASGLINKILAVKDNSNLMSIVDSVSSTVTPDFSTLAFMSTNCVITNQSLLPVPIQLSETKVKEIEQSLSATPSFSSVSGAKSSTGYQPYSSPLLMFTSYRLNPAFRSTSNKTPFSSVTYSNKMDPNKVMCRFELTGVCNDPKCTAQHLRDVVMSKEELTRDVISYAPSLAGCTEQELVSLSNADQPEVIEAINSKVSAFSSKFVERYGDRVSDEELFRLAIHEANNERVKGKGGSKKEFISFEDPISRSCLLESTRKKLLEKLQPIEHNPSLTGIDHSPDPIASLSALLPVKTEERRRYFDTEEEKRDRGGPSEDSGPSSSDTSSILASAQKLIKEKKLEQAIVLLEKSRLNLPDVWILFLRVKAELILVAQEQFEGLYQFFPKAVEATGSYAVILETVRLALCFKSKLKAINEGLAHLKKHPQSEQDITSRRYFELFINAILLDLQTGRSSVALKRFNQARQSSEEGKGNHFKGLWSFMSRAERILFSLCQLCVLYCGQLPGSFFSADSHHTIPVKIINFQPFAIPFMRTTDLPQQDYKKILRLFKIYFELLNDSSSSSQRAVELSLPLYRNLLLFEATHGSHQKAINMLNKLTALCPHLTDLWMTLARIKELDGVNSSDVLKQAVQSCPRRAELYYLAARLELSRTDPQKECEGQVSRVKEAVEWLVECVRKFYVDAPKELSTAGVLTLYRKLLNQMVGYGQSVPPFAAGVDMKNLGDQHTPLWLCYCLLVEVTVAPSSSLQSSSLLGEGLFHTGPEEAYESALHCIHSCEDRKAIWMEYIHYMRPRGMLSQVGFQRFLDCVQRCILDVDWSRLYQHATITSMDTGILTFTCEDYTFHNEMIDLVVDCLPPSSPLKLSLLRKFAKFLPTNTVLLSRVVQCALVQQPVCIDIAQTTLAEYLALNPHCPSLWKLAIDVEIQLKHTKEARWMFNRALQAVPLHAKLWMNLLVFELKEVAGEKPDPGLTVTPAITRAMFDVVKKAYYFGVDLLAILREISSKSQPTIST